MKNIKKFQAINFNIQELDGISFKNIEEHLKIYNGYVKNANLILEKISEYEKDKEANAYIISELRRRFSFEFAGVRNHEQYFKSFENGAKPIEKNSDLYKAIVRDFGSFEDWLSEFKTIAATRGIGWAILYYDKQSGILRNHWVDEHHLGHLVGLTPILSLDMWEHAFVYDYATSEKKKYINTYFAILNWNVIEETLKKSL